MPKLSGAPLLLKELASLNKSNRELRKHLTELTASVRTCLEALDVEMKSPSTNERGKRIANICNALEMMNDQARYFGLGIDYRTDKKRG